MKRWVEGMEKWEQSRKQSEEVLVITNEEIKGKRSLK